MGCSLLCTVVECSQGDAPCNVLLLGVIKGMLPVMYCGWGNQWDAPCNVLWLGVIKGMLPVMYCSWG